MPNFLFCGDLHGNFGHVLDTARAHVVDAVFLLGDVEPAEPLQDILAPIWDKVWLIHGNHDTGSTRSVQYMFDPIVQTRNLHGRVVNIGGLRVAGLGGIFRGSIWYPPAAKHFTSTRDYDDYLEAGTARHEWTALAQARLQRTHQSSIFPEVYDSLLAQQADVLITHEAPRCHPHGFAALNMLARAMGVRKVFHGHHHDNLDYTAHFATMGFAAFGVGFCGISDFDGKVIRVGEFDDEPRTYRRQVPLAVS
jgi:predicted phosphodiesterase